MKRRRRWPWASGRAATTARDVSFVKRSHQHRDRVRAPVEPATAAVLLITLLPAGWVERRGLYFVYCVRGVIRCWSPVVSCRLLPPPPSTLHNNILFFFFFLFARFALPLFEFLNFKRDTFRRSVSRRVSFVFPRFLFSPFRFVFFFTSFCSPTPSGRRFWLCPRDVRASPSTAAATSRRAGPSLEPFNDAPVQVDFAVAVTRRSRPRARRPSPRPDDTQPDDRRWPSFDCCAPPRPWPRSASKRRPPEPDRCLWSCLPPGKWTARRPTVCPGIFLRTLTCPLLSYVVRCPVRGFQSIGLDFSHWKPSHTDTLEWRPDERVRYFVVARS